MSFNTVAAPDQARPDLRRYFYCFKFVELAPYVYQPYSIAIVSEDGEQEFSVLIAEGLEKASADIRSQVEGNALIMSRDQIKNYLLGKFVKPAKKVEFWSFQDIYYRHMFAELFGGIDRNSNILFRQAGVEHLLHRDMQHLYVGMGKPLHVIGQQPPENKFDALRTAKWGLWAFKQFRDFSQDHPVSSVPITENPENLCRLFHDWEYWRKEDGVIFPLSVGLISQDGKTMLHGIFREYVEEFMTKDPVHYNEHEVFIARKVIPKIMKDHQAIWGKSAEIAEGIIDMIPEIDLLELWSDHDVHDRYLVGATQTSEGWGIISELRHRKKVRAVLARDTVHAQVHLGWPAGQPAQMLDTTHHGLGDARHNREIFNYLQTYARQNGIQADPIIPDDFKRSVSSVPLPQPLLQ